MKHVTFHLPSFLRRVRIHGGEFDSSARAMNRVSEESSLMTYERAFIAQAEPRIVRGSTIERKQMSTKTTFKRIALVAVAALGFGVLSVVPSSATVAGATVTVSNGAATNLLADSTTAATITLGWTATAGASDSFTTQVAYRAPNPAAATAVAPKILYSESSTSVVGTNPVVDTTSAGTAVDADKVFDKGAAIAFDSALNIRSGSSNGITHSATFKLYLGETGTDKVVAGTYKFNVITTIAGVVTITPVDIVVTAVVAATPVPSAPNAKAFIHAGSGALPATLLVDSATSGSLEAGTVIGKIRVSNLTVADATASDTITVVMTGVGYLTTTTGTPVTGRSFVIVNEDVLEMNVIADGSSGVGTITITTEKGAKFVKTVTFFDTKPKTVTATVDKKFIKAGTGSVADVFAVTVVDGSGNAVTNATIKAAATDTATTVGGAATCGAYDTTDSVYYCAVAGKAADKFGPVAYTITATGQDTLKTAVTTSATVTFADNVATKAVLAGPATGTPGATVEYTLTLTEKNGYAVADQTYGVGSEGGVLFAKSVVSGWTTAPFATTESFTSVSGVITSEGILPIAGVATGTWTLVGDGLQTLAANAIDKTIGKTTVTVSTDVANPGVDAATDAANEATDAANAATDAALAAAEAADAATSAAQEASDAVAALSESVTKLIAGLQAQIKSLAAVVAKIAKKVKA